jgi:hypothetical protein
MQVDKNPIVAKKINLDMHSVTDGILKMDLDIRNGMLLFLKLRSESLKKFVEENPGAEDWPAVVSEFTDLLDNHVTKLEVKKIKGTEYKIDHVISASSPEEAERINTRFGDLMGTAPIPMLFRLLLNIGDVKPKKKERKQIGDHNQPRSYGKTMAKIVGRDRDVQTLFSLPMEDLKEAIQAQIEKSTTGIPIKQVISKTTAVLGNALLAKYQREQKDSEGYISIDNLTELADEINTSRKELKYYLLYLGGYQYPSVVHDVQKKEIGIQLAKLFDVEFRYHEKDATIKADNMLTIDALTLIREASIKRVRIKPSQQLIRDMEARAGKTLGYVPVTDGFMKLILGLNDLAYKIFCFSYSNKPKYKISEKKLFDSLGLDKRAKQQGLPDTRKAIASAMEDLKQRGHFSDYTLPGQQADFYTWVYTDQYIKTRAKEDQGGGTLNEKRGTLNET